MGSGYTVDEFEESIEAEPTVGAIHQHLRLSDSALYRAQWAEQIQSLLYSIAVELGIQSSSTSETLRRATAELIANTLLEKRMA